MIGNYVVREEMRGRGVGGALWRRAQQAAAERQYLFGGMRAMQCAERSVPFVADDKIEMYKRKGFVIQADYFQYFLFAKMQNVEPQRLDIDAKLCLKNVNELGDQWNAVYEVRQRFFFCCNLKNFCKPENA